MDGWDSNEFMDNLQRLLEASGYFANCNFYRRKVPLTPKYPMIVLFERTEITTGHVGGLLNSVDVVMGIAYFEKDGTNLANTRFKNLHKFFHDNPTLNDISGNRTCNAITGIVRNEMSQKSSALLGEGYDGWEAAVTIYIGYAY